MTMLRAGGLLDELTSLSDCRHETVERIMERTISRVSCMCWMDFHNAILCCGFLCARLISFYSVCIVSLLSLFRLPRRGLPRPIYSARANTPIPPLHGYHACVYISRLPRHCSLFYSQVITLELSRSTTHVHRVITPAIVSNWQFTNHRLLLHLLFSIYPTTGAPHVPTYSTCAILGDFVICFRIRLRHFVLPQEIYVVTALIMYCTAVLLYCCTVRYCSALYCTVLYYTLRCQCITALYQCCDI